MPLNTIQNRDILQGRRVAHPCAKTWDPMNGDDRSRHCDDCNRNVVNLSDCTGAEIRRLLDAATLAPCVRFDSNLDGTVITRTRLGRVATMVRRVVTAAAVMLLGAVIATPAQSGTNAPSDESATAHREPRRTSKRTARPRHKRAAPPVTMTIGALIPVELPNYVPPLIDDTVPGNAVPTTDGIKTVPEPTVPADPTKEPAPVDIPPN